MRYGIWLITVLLLLGMSACGSNLYKRAQIYEAREDYRSAIDAYKRMSQKSEGYQQALANAALGRLYVKLGRYWEAKDVLEQAKQEIPSADPEYARVCYYLGYCYYEIGEQWANHAIDALEQAVTVVPKAHLYLSVLYYEHGQYDAALRHTDRVGGGDEAEAKYISGLIYRKLGGLSNFEKAMAALQRAVELEKNLDTKRTYQDVLEAMDREIREVVAKGKKIDRIQLKPIFSAIAGYYAQHPIGQVTIRNPTNQTLRDAVLSLRIGDFMDDPATYSVGNIGPRKDATVDLTVNFSSRIQQVKEDLDAVPVTLSLEYTSDEGEQIETAPTTYVRIYDVNALDWSPQEAIAAFVTHKNEAIATISRHASIIGNPLEKAIQIYEALNLYGIQYELDPQDPYGEDIDYIFYPFETLKYRKGDCDDLSVLYASCLQNIGIETALVLTPTHIFVMFNTGMSSARAKRVIPDANLYRIQDKMAWIPVEVTMLGKGMGNFFEAWSKGRDEYRPEYPIVFVSDAWNDFRPATQGETLPSLEAALPETAAILQAYNQVVAKAESYWRGVFENDIRYYQEQIDAGQGELADLQNKMGIRLAWLERFGEAEEKFRTAVLHAPSVVRYHNNLGNALFLQGDLDGAQEEYARALEGSGPSTVPVRFNRAIFYFAQQQSDLAQQELSQITEGAKDQEAAGQVMTLARELGIPITVSPRAGDLPELVKTKMMQAARAYQERKDRRECVDLYLQQLTEEISEEERSQFREKLMRMPLDVLRQHLAEVSKTPDTADRDLELVEDARDEASVPEEAPVSESPVSESEEAPASEDTSVSEETPAAEETSVTDEKPAVPALSRDEIEKLFGQVFELEITGTRAAGISEPEGLQWWLHWME